jgi:5'-nucleotidase
VSYDLSSLLVVGISSRALFDLEAEDRLYRRLGLEKYRETQLANEKDILDAGTAFPLVKGLLALNTGRSRCVEVIIVSHNHPETGVRVMNSVRAHGLDITRAAFIGTEPLAPHLQIFQVDLFLSCSRDDVQTAIDAGVAAAIVYGPPNEFPADIAPLKLAFDADAVLFADESEVIYRRSGLKAFQEHEQKNADFELRDGPFGPLLRKLGLLQGTFPVDTPPIKIAIVSARNSPAEERVIKTLRSWGVRIDAAYFLGGIAKEEILKAFGAHIFFDDQEAYLAPAARYTPCALVPYKTGSVLRELVQDQSIASTTVVLHREPAA